MTSYLSGIATRQILRPGLNVSGGHQCARQLVPNFNRGGLYPPRRLQHTLQLRGSPSLIWSTTQNSSFRPKRVILPFLMKGACVAGVGLGLASLNQPAIQCDSPSKTPIATPTPPPVPADEGGLPPPPASSVSLYELGFGTVAGICAGIFVKKGSKALAWLLGGIFVLLQYLASTSIIRVDWARVGKKFENQFHTTDASGASRPPTVLMLWNWLINFLTADFQPRASFIVGFALGLRIG